MSYYRTIGGRKMDANLIDKAAQLVQQARDGRISVKDASALMKVVRDGSTITEVEKDTIEYIFRNFVWTSTAQEWFRDELESSLSPITMTLAELDRKHFATKDVLPDPVDQTERKHELEAAMTETNQDHDEIALWVRLSDGRTVRVFSDFIELENEFVELHGGCLVPIRAICKVEL